MDIIEELNKKTKAEIIDILVDIMENEKIDKSVFEKRLTTDEYTPEEQTIIDKLNTHKAITQEELTYIKTRLEKRANTRIRTILSGVGKKFDTFLVRIKLSQYFTAIWRIYPRKVGKAQAEKAFEKLVSEQKLGLLNQYCEYIIKRVSAYIEMCQDNNTEEQYILHFATFCNSKKYL